MKEKKGNKCEAVYGNKRCEKLASSMVVSKGQIFSLCRNCYKQEKAQQKINHEN